MSKILYSSTTFLYTAGSPLRRRRLRLPCTLCSCRSTLTITFFGFFLWWYLFISAWPGSFSSSFGAPPVSAIRREREKWVAEGRLSRASLEGKIRLVEGIDGERKNRVQIAGGDVLLDAVGGGGGGIEVGQEEGRYAFATFLSGDTKKGKKKKHKHKYKSKPKHKHQSSSSSGQDTKDHGDGDEETEDDMHNDKYFLATRVLAYQLLHSPSTRTNRSTPFIVAVTSTVSPAKRARLSLDGATVIPVEDVPLRWWIRTGVTRWKDQFTKLRLFELIEYDRIAFIDADTLILKNMDGIFDDAAVKAPSIVDTNSGGCSPKSDEAPLPGSYVFAARSDNALAGEREHPYPPTYEADAFSAGFWVARPSLVLFDYYYSVMSHWRRFDPHTMEQSLLNYAHRRPKADDGGEGKGGGEGGCMPWKSLGYNWSATWPNEADLQGGVASMHEKFWVTGPTELRALWQRQKRSMERFWKEREEEI